MDSGISYASLFVEGVNSDVKTCSRRGCPKPANGLLSPDLCDDHHEDQKRYQRECMARKREQWDADGMCTRCGGKRSKTGVHCVRCKVSLGRLAGVKNDVKNPARSSRDYVETDGYARSRGHGRAKRGAPSLDDQDEFERRIVDTGVRRYLDACKYLASDAGKALAPADREAARMAAFGQLALATRAADDILDRNRYGAKLAKQEQKARGDRYRRDITATAREIAKTGR